MRDLRDGRRSGGAPPAPTASRRRRRRVRLPWWLDFGFEVGKPAIVLGLIAIVLVTLGLLGARAIVQDRRDDAVAARPGGSESIYDGPRAPNYGQPMSAAMKLRLARFGIPLHIGPRGVPLLEDRLTGEVREATELELTFPETAESVPTGLNPDVAAVPGPGGGAVMWEEPAGFRELPDAVPVGRVKWFSEQETRVDAVVKDLTLAAAHITSVDHRRWDDRWGAELSAIAQALTDKYAWGQSRYWPLAGSISYCDPALERVARGGVTDGCPSVELQQTIVTFWSTIGHLVETMRLMGDAAQLPYDRQIGAHFRDAEVLEYQERHLRRIDLGMDRVRSLVDDFRQLSSEEGFYVHIWVP